MKALIKQLVYPSCMRLQQQYAPKALSKRAKATCVLATRGPLVSIVVPSFNQARYLDATLHSILSQSYPNIEVIVIDGGSTDGSKQILEHYGSRLKYWVSEPDNGQTHAINKGFARASGEVLAWLNSDDLLMPGAVARAVASLYSDKQTDVVYGDRVIINEDSWDIGVWRTWHAHDSVLAYADFIPQETLFWRRAVWDKVGASLDENFQFAMDWDLLLRFKAANANFKKLDAFQGAFRFHPEQKTVCSIGSIGFNEMELLRERCAKQDGLENYNKQKMHREVLKFMLTTRWRELIS